MSGRGGSGAERERVAGVVLAAGRGERMEDRFKLLLPLGRGAGEETVIRASVRTALRAGLDPVVVVTGHRGEEVRRALTDLDAPTPLRASAGPGGRDGEDEARRPAPRGDRVRVVHDPRHAGSQAASLAGGIRAIRTASEADAAAVLMGDEPGIRADCIREAVTAWRRGARQGGRPPVVRARYRDRPGHPVIFPRSVFGELEALEGDRGAREWLEETDVEVRDLELDAPGPIDLDTPEDYRRLTGGERDAGSDSAREPG